MGAQFKVDSEQEPCRLTLQKIKAMSVLVPLELSQPRSVRMRSAWKLPSVLLGRWCC